MAKKGKFFFISIVMLVLVFGLVYAGITLTSNFGKSTTQVSTENAGKELGKLYADIAPATAEPVKGQIDLDPGRCSRITAGYLEISDCCREYDE